MSVKIGQPVRFHNQIQANRSGPTAVADAADCHQRRPRWSIVDLKSGTLISHFGNNVPRHALFAPCRVILGQSRNEAAVPTVSPYGGLDTTKNSENQAAEPRSHWSRW